MWYGGWSGNYQRWEGCEKGNGERGTGNGECVGKGSPALK
jgi:hypothetical protein